MVSLLILTWKQSCSKTVNYSYCQQTAKEYNLYTLAMKSEVDDGEQGGSREHATYFKKNILSLLICEQWSINKRNQEDMV